MVTLKMAVVPSNTALLTILSALRLNLGWIPVGKMPLLSPFHGWGITSSERSYNLPKFTQVWSIRPGVSIKAVSSLSLWSWAFSDSRESLEKEDCIQNIYVPFAQELLENLRQDPSVWCGRQLPPAVTLLHDFFDRITNALSNEGLHLLLCKFFSCNPTSVKLLFRVECPLRILGECPYLGFVILGSQLFYLFKCNHSFVVSHLHFWGDQVKEAI